MIVRTALLIVATAVAAGCANDEQPRYPARQVQALQQLPAAVVPELAAQRFVAFFTAIDQPGVAQRVAALYSPTLHFSDTLFVTDDHDALARHFQRLHERGVHIDIDLDDAVTSGRDLYLRWRMRVSYPARGDSSPDETIGMTQLRFDESGKVLFQQDYWDSAEGVYRHIPGIGWVIDLVAAQISKET
jgi:hypothetical protein